MDIKNIEYMLMRSWPALKQEIYDGWIIRFSEGYTMMGNTVAPYYESFLEHNEKYDYCEKYFESRGLKVSYRLLEDKNCLLIDKELESRNYSKEELTSVQEAKLIDIKFNAKNFILENEFSEYWYEFFTREMDLTIKNSEILKKILTKEENKNFYVLKKIDNKIVAGGLGVIEEDKLEIHHVYVCPSVRGQGFGEEVVKRIMLEGRSRNVKYAYLQVPIDNISAVNLYKKLGFKEIYKYWYRLKN